MLSHRLSRFVRPSLLGFTLALSSAAGVAFSTKISQLPVAGPPKVTLDHEQLKRNLSPLAYTVLFEHGTERAWTSPLNDLPSSAAGVFSCAACGQPLFSTSGKFDSGSGWPSFFEPISADAVGVRTDKSYGMTRDEVVCSNCGGHLGHVFPDGPRDKTGLRYCINGVSLDYKANSSL